MVDLEHYRQRSCPMQSQRGASDDGIRRADACRHAASRDAASPRSGPVSARYSNPHCDILHSWNNSHLFVGVVHDSLTNMLGRLRHVR